MFLYFAARAARGILIEYAELLNIYMTHTYKNTPTHTHTKHIQARTRGIRELMNVYPYF